MGVCEDYYDSIKSNFPDDKQREEIFCALNDIAFDLELFDKVKNLDVVQTSLMRDYTSRVIKNQFHRMTMGGAWLTPYKFSYFPDGEVDVLGENVTELEFKDDIVQYSYIGLATKNGIKNIDMLAKDFAGS